MRSYAIHASYQNLNWTQLLLPLYFTYYQDDNGVIHPIYVNGQSGVIGGARLASQRKGWVYAGALAGVGLVLFLIGLLMAVLGVAMPPVAILGVLLIIAGVAACVGAIFPAAWPWQWNRKQVQQRIISS